MSNPPACFEGDVEMKSTSMRLLIPCLGFGVYWAWVTVTFYSSAVTPGLDGPDSPIESFWSYATCAHAIGLLLGAVIPYERRRKPPSDIDLTRTPTAFTIAVWASAFCMALGSMLFAFGVQYVDVEHRLVTTLVAACIVGLSSAIHVLCWGEAFASIPVGDVVLCSAASFCFGLLAWFMLAAIPPDLARFTSALALPLGSATALSLQRLAPHHPMRTHANAGLSTEPVRLFESFVLVVALFIFALCGELLRSLATSLENTTTDTMGALYLGGGLIGLVLLCAYFTGLRRLSDSPPISMSVVRSILLIMAAAFLFAPFLETYSFAVCYGVFGAGFWCFRALSWMYCFLFIQRFEANPRHVVATLDMTFALSVVAGSAVTPQLTEALRSSTLQTAAVSLVIVFTLMFISMFVLYNRQATTVLGMPSLAAETAIHSLAGPEIGPKSGAPTNQNHESRSDPTERIMGIAARHGLTERETEVALLLAQGRSLPFVQEALCISAGTAQTHARHIYKKMGVHTKQELIDAFKAPDIAP